MRSYRKCRIFDLRAAVPLEEAWIYGHLMVGIYERWLQLKCPLLQIFSANFNSFPATSKLSYGSPSAP
jgi:hypothetical protein